MYKNIDKLSDNVKNRFTLVILASKRAREINKYLIGLKKGELTHVKGPRIEMAMEKPLTIAFKEIAEGDITYTAEADANK